MSISVVLPVHNGARTLRQAIESILRQTHRDFELLVIDDASTDESRKIIGDYAERDARVRQILHDRNAGLAETLNEGLAAARYELVARMDQDDESLPRRFETQKSFFDEHPAVAVVGSWVFHMGARREFDRLVRVPVEHDAILARLAKENCLYHPSVMLRRSAVTEVGGYRAEFKNAEDYDLWLRLSKAHRLANVPEGLLRYRFSVDGMTLGRKWEQLFYVHLAQATLEDPAISLEEARERARASLAEVDRPSFLMQVAVDTVWELAALRHGRDALSLGARFARDARPRGTVALLAHVARVGQWKLLHAWSKHGRLLKNRSGVARWGG